MFESLKEKLQSVQVNISSSLRGLTVNENVVKSDNNSSLINQINLSAGTDVLERFQNSWAEIHSQTQENSKQAQVVDELIGKLYGRIETQWRNITHINTALSRLPEVIHEIDVLSDKLCELDQMFVSVEKSLVQLGDLIETRELQDRQLDHRFQLALYKEKKLANLENARVNLAREHAEKVASHEARQLRIQKERQEAFEQQFKQDLNVYKETQAVPRVDIMESTPTKLEDVQLDNEDEEALNEFLHEKTPDRASEDSEASKGSKSNGEETS